MRSFYILSPFIQWAKRSKLEKSEIEAAKKKAEERLAAAAQLPDVPLTNRADDEKSQTNFTRWDVTVVSKETRDTAVDDATKANDQVNDISMESKISGETKVNPVSKLLDMGTWWLCTTFNVKNSTDQSSPSSPPPLVARLPRT